jgi:hypothetical protein
LVYMANNFDTPESLPEGLAGPEKEKWEELIAKESMNITSRKCWKMVSKKVSGQMKRKIMKTKITLKKEA